ncbi:hypothetical protein SAMN06265370_110142 [Puniceibacterium sediminis]|uniref:BNR repeat-like domain-containing protein n=1 Tax=Puniceibacterium sediminis TaxID=1608407 RepID=A0A238XEA0_9RHOB|nr:hypothetical protein SAMN06265370_110142 [Puniceibacterium sediminis]
MYPVNAAMSDARRASLYDELGEDDTRPDADPAGGGLPVWGVLRAPVALCLSADGGRTFPERFLIEDGVGACLSNNSVDGQNRELSYPWLIEARDGCLHLAYTYHRRAIKHVRLDTGWRGRLEKLENLCRLFGRNASPGRMRRSRSKPLGAQLPGINQRGQYVDVVRPTHTRDIEGCAMIHRRTVDRQAERDSHSGIKRDQLVRNMPLIVILGHDQIEIPTVGPIVIRIRRLHRLRLSLRPGPFLRPGGPVGHPHVRTARFPRSVGVIPATAIRGFATPMRWNGRWPTWIVSATLWGVAWVRRPSGKHVLRHG